MDVSIVKKLGILLNNVPTDSWAEDKKEEDLVEIDMKVINIVEEKNKEAEVKVIIMSVKDIKEDIESLDHVNTLHMNIIEEETTEDKGVDIRIQDLGLDLIKIAVTDVEVKNQIILDEFEREEKREGR